MSSNKMRLGDVLNSRMLKTSNAAVPTTVELGTINSNLSLSSDSLGTSIPKGQYMVNILFSGRTDKAFIGGDHEHDHGLPKLKSGDRVLIVWCGNEPVVMAVVVSS